LDVVFKIAPISDHAAKFRGDQPRDRDLTLNKKERKKEKKRNKQQQNIRAAAHCIIATGSPD